MKKKILFLTIFSLLNHGQSFAKNDIDPFRQIEKNHLNFFIDNPKGKLKIRFLRNEDKSDTTNQQKGFFGKLRNVVNMLLNASENPPFKVEIIREKTKKIK